MSGMIFISYRRGDDPGSTGRLFERLQVEGFASDQLFMDIDSIAPGIDFMRELLRQVEKSDVMLAVIGKGWLDARDAAGARRLDSPDDFVRVEIEAALKQDKRVIPVLMQDAAMPRADELPDGLKPLATRNYVRLTHERFRLDTQLLVKALREALDEAVAAREQDAVRARQQSEVEARRQKAEVRRVATAALSAEQIAKAEELANWDFIKLSADAEDFRDHLARFPGGVCQRMARHRLASLAWSALGSGRGKDALASYLKEFPDGPHAEDAKRELALLEQRAAAQPSAVEPKWAQRWRGRALAGLGVFALIVGAGTMVALQSSQQPPAPALAPDPEPKLIGEPKLIRKGVDLPEPKLIGEPKLIRKGVEVTTMPAAEPPLVVPKPVPAQRPPLVVPTPVPAQRPPKSAAASKCPSSSDKAEFDVSLSAGFKSFRRRVALGGQVDLSGCRSDMIGWVTSRPNVAVQYEASSGRTLEVSSNVGTVLAVVDPKGAWHFGVSNDPRVIFRSAAGGRYAIWVGRPRLISSDQREHELVITER